MGGYGVNLAEEGHIVNILAPVDINGGKSCDVFSMANYSHATIILQLGVTGGTSVVTLEECDNFDPTTDTAIAFNYYIETTAAGDTLAARTAVTSSGFTTSANDGITYVIEVDADELSEGYPCLQLELATPGASVIASAVAILTGGIKGGITPTAII